MDVEGLIAITSIHQKARVAPETIHKILDAYDKIQPNLLKHEPGYPTAFELKSKVRKGLALYGMQGVGDGHDSDGSELIIKVLEKESAHTQTFEEARFACRLSLTATVEIF